MGGRAKKMSRNIKVSHLKYCYETVALHKNQKTSFMIDFTFHFKKRTLGIYQFQNIQSPKKIQSSTVIQIYLFFHL